MYTRARYDYISKEDRISYFLIGHGSFGRVFAVRNKPAGRDSPSNVYALKVQRIFSIRKDDDSVSARVFYKESRHLLIPLKAEKKTK